LSNKRDRNGLSDRWAIAVVACVLCITCSSTTVCAQQNPQQTANPPASPGGGITSGTAAIETTLFAYRSLSSDSEAISREVLALTNTNTNKIVIGTTADLAAFAQWRAIMAEAILLDSRAIQIHHDFSGITDYPPDDNAQTPLASLTLSEAHSSGKLTKGGTMYFWLTVSNSSGSRGASGLVKVVFTSPTGWTVTGAPPANGLGANGWTCPLAGGNSVTCTRSDPLPVFSNYPTILLSVLIGPAAPASDPAPTAAITLTGGGAPPPTPPVLTVTLSNPSPPAPPVGARGAGQQAAAPPAGQSPSTSSSGAGGGALSSLTGAIPVFATVLGQAFAVQETISASQGSMTDTPLIHMVAEKLREGGETVLIPSVYAPYMLRNGTLRDTYLWNMLVDLEGHRYDLWTDLATASKVLSKETYILQNASKYSASDVTAALNFSGELQSLTSSAQAVATSIDSFETSLFGGQPPTQQPQQTQNSQNQTANPSSPQNGSPSGGTPANPSSNQPNTPAANQGNNPTGNSPGSPAANSPGNPNGPTSPQSPQNSQQTTMTTGGQVTSLLPQILGADLLAHALWSDPEWPTDGNPAPTDFEIKAAENFKSEMDKVNFLTLHALESGGSELNKSNFFFGTHIFFSGGSVATFGLYKVSGEVRCSGFVYDYEGNIREKKYDQALRLPQLPAIIATDFSSCQSAQRGNAVVLRRGMTAPEAFSAARVPYRTIAVHKDSYIYEFDDFNRTRIEIRNGVVTKVMKSR
jgi:hypothetical protein